MDKLPAPRRERTPGTLDLTSLSTNVPTRSTILNKWSLLICLFRYTCEIKRVNECYIQPFVKRKKKKTFK